MLTLVGQAGLEVLDPGLPGFEQVVFFVGRLEEDYSVEVVWGRVEKYFIKDFFLYLEPLFLNLSF